MASNSLLECLVFAKTCAKHINKNERQIDDLPTFEDWDASRVEHSQEKVVVSHLWHEVRRLMWNFVGIVRSDRRLQSAQRRLAQIQKEVNDYYRLYILTEDLIELRNLVQTAQIIVESALSRKESRGLHFTLDYPEQLESAHNSVITKTS